MEFDENDDTHEKEAVIQDELLPEGPADTVQFKDGILTIGCVGMYL